MQYIYVTFKIQDGEHQHAGGRIIETLEGQTTQGAIHNSFGDSCSEWNGSTYYYDNEYAYTVNNWHPITSKQKDFLNSIGIN